MAVVATAGRVDHGKSTLVRLLTGTEPDRWAQERARGLTIDLGYAWTDLDGVHLSLDLAAALQTSRRVVIPLLERLDTDVVTRRLPDGTRVVRQLPDGTPRP